MTNDRPDGCGRVGKVGLGLSMALYLASFVAPYSPEASGGKIFLCGLVYCWLVPITTAWWANPLYWTALTMGFAGRWRGCAGFGLCAVMTACLNLRYEPPPRAPAYFLWIGAMITITLQPLWSAFVPESPRPPRKGAVSRWDA
jgi:hypothetical protein